jgi:hypothetical protein
VRAFATGRTEGGSGQIERLDQKNEKSGGFGYIDLSSIAQTFTAGYSGELSYIELSLRGTDDSSTSIVSIYDSNWEKLATANINSVTPERYSFYPVSFSSPPTFVIDQQYAIVVSSGDGSYFIGPGSSQSTEVLWEDSGDNPDDDTYPSGSMYTFTGGTAQGSASEGSQWRENPNNDFLFRTYVKTTGDGGNIVSMISFGENTVYKIIGTDNPNGNDDEGNYQGTDYDQIITFSTSVGAGESIDLFGYYTDPNKPDGGYTNYPDGDSVTKRNFIAADSVGGRGICIDLIDEVDGTDELKVRLWIFDTGEILYNQDIDYDVKAASNSITKTSPNSAENLILEPKINIVGNNIDINILQMTSDGDSVGGTGGVSCTLKTTLEESFTLRDVIDAASFKMQIHKSSAWVSWLKKVDAFDFTATDVDSGNIINEFTYDPAVPNPPSITINQAICSVEIMV